jgi:hypothetical protein
LASLAPAELAKTVGPATAQVFAEILKSKPHSEMGYCSCLGILRPGCPLLEAASRRAVLTGACSYPRVKSILERSLDCQTLETPTASSPLAHQNLRGASFDSASRSTGAQCSLYSPREHECQINRLSKNSRPFACRAWPRPFAPEPIPLNATALQL